LDGEGEGAHLDRPAPDLADRIGALDVEPLREPLISPADPDVDGGEVDVPHAPEPPPGRLPRRRERADPPILDDESPHLDPWLEDLDEEVESGHDGVDGK